MSLVSFLSYVLELFVVVYDEGKLSIQEEEEEEEK